MFREGVVGFNGMGLLSLGECEMAPVGFAESGLGPLGPDLPENGCIQRCVGCLPPGAGPVPLRRHRFDHLFGVEGFFGFVENLCGSIECAQLAGRFRGRVRRLLGGWFLAGNRLFGGLGFRGGSLGHDLVSFVGKIAPPTEGDQRPRFRTDANTTGELPRVATNIQSILERFSRVLWIIWIVPKHLRVDAVDLPG